MEINDKVNILMVDDQPAKLLSYEAILGDLDENLIKASSGREALECLLKNDIAVVLTDVSMPEMDGFDLAETIRQHPRFQKTAIIFISAIHLSDTDRIQGYRRGAVDYISVPVVPEVLRAKVSVFAELHRKARQLELLNRELEDRVAERSEELRQVNLQLQQRVTELETVMQVLPVGVSMAHDPECRLVTGNVALSQILGTQPGENISHTSNEANLPYEVFLNSHRLSPDQLPLQMAVTTGQPVPSMELELHRPGLSPTFLLASASPLFDEAGGVRGAVAALYDVTSRKRMEQELRERVDLLELASEAIVVRDMDGLVRYWNSGAASVYGFTAEEALGSELHNLLQTQFPVPRKEIELALLAGQRWEGNLTQYTKDGREIILACRKILQRENGVPRAVLEICRDITAQLKAEEALRKSERLAVMGRVAGIIAHEINNPLEAVSNLFYLLRDHPSLDMEARQYAQLGEQEILRTLHITRQTLGFYRETQQPVAVSIPQLLDDVLSLQTRRMELNGIVLEKRYNCDAAIRGFPGELRQVFLNLIGNAMQAMPEGGRMRVHLACSYRDDTGKPEGISVTITDTGSGITPENAKHIFEPFFSTKAAKGTGLGLWITRGIVQKYDGTIQFRSVRRAGRCVTSFRVSFPEKVMETAPESDKYSSVTIG